MEDPYLVIQTMILIHTRFLYRLMHCVHHRHTGVDPFSGLCMHPLEHMLYFSCYAPCLLGGLHPFLLLRMGVHSVIAPAASHSGYEDHFSADVVHYLHHRYTECNYSLPSFQDVQFSFAHRLIHRRFIASGVECAGQENMGGVVCLRASIV
jgi:hypothetical protein